MGNLQKQFEQSPQQEQQTHQVPVKDGLEFVEFKSFLDGYVAGAAAMAEQAKSRRLSQICGAPELEPAVLQPQHTPQHTPQPSIVEFPNAK